MRFHTAVNKFCWQAVMGQPLSVWRTAQHQVRPYLDLQDAVRAVGFILERQLFDGRVYNVVTENLALEDITRMIRSYVADLTVELVDSPIMNQLSYEVSNERLASKGFQCQGQIDRAISETIELLQHCASARR
jgi:UDP-glucose 4-epimerase